MKYTNEEIDRLFQKVLYEMAINGKSLTQIVKEKDTPSKESFYKWITATEEDSEEEKEKKRERSNQYAQAHTLRADQIFDEIIELADSEDDITYLDKHGNKRIDWGKVQRNKTQIDARKWIIAKMNPKKYGDKIDHTTDGKEIKQQNIINLGGGKNPNEEN